MRQSEETPFLSPWWRHTVILVMIAGFSVLSYLTYRTYTDAPPIPVRVKTRRAAPCSRRPRFSAGRRCS